MSRLRKYLFPQITLLFTILSLLSTACSASTPLTTQEQLGFRLFIQHCASCHSTVGDTVIVGPPLAGIATRAMTRVAELDARGYIEESILDPSAYLNSGYTDRMPKTFGAILTAEELDALIAFLMTLK